VLKAADAGLLEGDTVLGMLKSATAAMAAEGGTGELTAAAWTEGRHAPQGSGADAAASAGGGGGGGGGGGAAGAGAAGGGGGKKKGKGGPKYVEHNGPSAANVLKKGEGPQHHLKHEAVGESGHGGHHHHHSKGGAEAPKGGNTDGPTNHYFTGTEVAVGPRKHVEPLHAGQAAGEKPKKGKGGHKKH
jgi:hypothetical protein